MWLSESAMLAFKCDLEGDLSRSRGGREDGKKGGNAESFNDRMASNPWEPCQSHMGCTCTFFFSRRMLDAALLGSSD